MNENPEIRSKLLDWQRRFNIQDNDPALALIDLLDIYHRNPPAAGGQGPHFDAQTVTDAVRVAVQPAVDRLALQLQNLPSPSGHSPSAPELSGAVAASLQPSFDRLATRLQDIHPSATVSPEAVSEALKTSLLPAFDRMMFQIQELQKKIEDINSGDTAKKIESYNENIDYCTKKLDVMKKEADDLVVRIGRVGAEIKPVSRGAVLMLMFFCAVIGYVAAIAIKFS